MQFERTSGKSTVIRFLLGVFALWFAMMTPNNRIVVDGVSDARRLMAVEMVKDISCMASVIYDEARGEPEKGKIAVGAVIMNRVKSKKSPDTVCGVTNQKRNNICQFSGMCKNKPNQFDETSLRIATNIIRGEYDDPTKGAMYFHNDTVRPKWSKIYVRTTRIGNHTFYSQSFR